jgi:hypothetical protein
MERGTKQEWQEEATQKYAFLHTKEKCLHNKKGHEKPDEPLFAL